MRSNIARTEWKMVWRDNTALTVSIVLLLASLLAVIQGAGQTSRLHRSHQNQLERQKEHIARNVKAYGVSGLGDVLFYTSFPTWNEPSPWSRFAFGQRDVAPSEVRVRILTLAGQLYDSDAMNATLAAFGHFDLSFVLAFFTPLLIIAMSYDSFSADREMGLGPLLHSQLIRPAAWIRTRLLVRFSAASAILLSVFIAGTLCLGLPVELRWFAALATVMLHACFWFAVCTLVVLQRWSSTANAIALGTLWIVTAVAGPALAGVWVSTQAPIPAAFETTLRQREGYHSMWDQPKHVTMNRFYESFPEWRSVPVPQDKFSWGWYYAMQHIGDLEAAPATAAFRTQLRRRVDLSWEWAAWFPPVYAQFLLQRIAETDLTRHIQYLDSIAAFHLQLQRYWHPDLFHDTPLERVNWDAAPTHTLAASRELDAFWPRFAILALCSALAMALATWLLARQTRIPSE